MSQDPLLPPTFNSDWPEDIRQAYEHLKIPSLYDAVLANEKMSVELRKQSREIKSTNEGIQSLSMQLEMITKMLSEDWNEQMQDESGDWGEDQADQFSIRQIPEGELTDLEMQLLSERHFSIEKQPQKMLMECYDTMYEQASLARQMEHQIQALLPKKEGFLLSHIPAWLPIVEEILQNFVHMLVQSRYKLLNHFDEIHVDIVEPLIGDAFDERFHRRMNEQEGGTAGTIASVIRVGYALKDHLLRKADVSVYH